MQCAIIKGHKFRPKVTYAIPIIKPMRPTVMDLSDKSFVCLNPKMAACKTSAITVAKEVFEKSRSIQFIRKPLSNNSSSIDSIQMKGIINKKRPQFPFRFPNLEVEDSEEVSDINEKGSLSFMISKVIKEINMVSKIMAVIPTVLPI